MMTAYLFRFKFDTEFLSNSATLTKTDARKIVREFFKKYPELKQGLPTRKAKR
jgi:hypothetical protein